jgi:uncharacterized membrane protein YdjX (TVP38/TMEM64 family)
VNALRQETSTDASAELSAEASAAARSTRRRPGDGRASIRAALLVVLVLVVGGAAWYWREPLWALFGDQERIREWVAGFGPWAPLVSVALNVAQVLLAPVPGQFVGLVNGYLYGIWLGTLYSMAGLALGTTLAMALGRWLGRPLVERLAKPEALARWDRIADRQGPLFFFLVFLFPFVPDDVACFLVGLSPLAIPRMAVLAALGRLPGVFVSCWIGAYATELPRWAWIPLGGGAAALAWVFWRYQVQLEAVTVRLIRRVAGQRRSRAAPECSEAGEGRSAPPGANHRCAPG